jgi:hypothetical protein
MATSQKLILAAILALYTVVTVTGLNWGLPGKHLDEFLFPDGKLWSGETILGLIDGSKKFAADRGADVDVDPISSRDRTGPFALTDTPEGAAAVYLRYRLYTHQPDEMITMMALAGMRPSEGKLDPKLYQYGGLFIYPVGALIRLAGVLGWIDVRSDLAFYLDYPDEFGKFYFVARAYSAAWGLIGVLLVFAIAKRLGGVPAGILAALFFTLMPAVVCMAHEGKPHLPGAVLMLFAVWLAMRHLQQVEDSRRRIQETGRDSSGRILGTKDAPGDFVPRRFFLLMGAVCGASVGMVLSAGPILILIPLLTLLERSDCRTISPGTSTTEPRSPISLSASIGRALFGLAVTGLVYIAVNPYVFLNALFDREVLRSNFGNSLAMYEVARLGEGFVRMLELTVEGATLPLVILGVIGAVAYGRAEGRAALPLIAAAGVFFIQFVLIGAGKPGEYGRFGIFPNTALAIGTACLLGNLQGSGKRRPERIAAALVVLWCAVHGGRYLRNFRADAGLDHSRLQLARRISEESDRAAALGTKLEVALLREPAPYGCPPLDFARVKVMLYPSLDAFHSRAKDGPGLLLEPVDDQIAAPPDSAFRIPHSLFPLETPVSWANKPFRLESF